MQYFSNVMHIHSVIICSHGVLRPARVSWCSIDIDGLVSDATEDAVHDTKHTIRMNECRKRQFSAPTTLN
jgi:hypothetical protein